MIKTENGIDFDNSKTYYKITNKEENHNGLQFHDGLNVDPVPFNYEEDCCAGGIYFTNAKYIFKFLEYGCYVREITIPDDALIYEEYTKYKADKLIFGKRMDINLDTVRYLVDNGADIHAQDVTMIKYAAANGHLDMVKYLVENGANIHVLGDYPLSLAALVGQLDVVKYLVENGANINTVDGSALIWAVMNGQLDVVKYLVENGANIHVYGDEVLRRAAENGYLDIVKYLVDNGADVHTHYDSALRWATSNGHQDIAEYLKSLK